MISWSQMDRTRKRVILWSAGFTALVSAFASISQAFNATEDYHLATKGYVQQKVLNSAEGFRQENNKAALQMETLRSSGIDTQISIARNERSRVQDKIADRELLLQQYPDIPAPTRSAIEQQIRDWRDDISELNYSIDQLQRSRSGRRL